MSVFELAALQKLRRIGLVKVNNLTDQAIYALTPCATLERLHLSYCDQISVLAIYFMLQKLLKLTHLSLTGIDVFRKPEFQQFCRQPPSVSTSNWPFGVLPRLNPQQDFNSTQRAAFCVFSGKGIAKLREYLKERYTHVIEADGENDTDYDDDDDDVTRINTDNTREAGHSSRPHPPVTPGATTSAPGSHGDRTTYTGFSPPRRTNGVASLQAILGTDTSSGPAMQQRQGQGQFPTPGWGHGHVLQTPGSVLEPSIIPNLHTMGLAHLTLPNTSRTATQMGMLAGPTGPRALTVFANSQRLKERDGHLSSLNAAIETLNLAWEASGIEPAKHIYNHVGITLKMIKVCFLFSNDELLVYPQPGQRGRQNRMGRNRASLRRCVYSS